MAALAAENLRKTVTNKRIVLVQLTFSRIAIIISFKNLTSVM